MTNILTPTDIQVEIDVLSLNMNNIKNAVDVNYNIMNSVNFANGFGGTDTIILFDLPHSV